MSSSHFVLTVDQCCRASCEWWLWVQCCGEYSSAECCFHSNTECLFLKTILNVNELIWMKGSWQNMHRQLLLLKLLCGNWSLNLEQQVQSEEEHKYAFFQQGGATAHTSRFLMSYVHEDFGEERTVSTGLWPPRSPNLPTCDFYLWGILKDKVYSDNPHTIEELKTCICNAIEEITPNEFAKVDGNMLKCTELCV